MKPQKETKQTLRQNAQSEFDQFAVRIGLIPTNITETVPPNVSALFDELAELCESFVGGASEKLREIKEAGNLKTKWFESEKIDLNGNKITANTTWLD